MTTVLKITGWSGGTIDLVSSVYDVDTDRWVPSVATRKQSRLAGAIYTDASENIPIKISGATATAILASAGDLVAAIDQSMRWSRGENVDAVVLEYKPDGSSATGNYKAVITGSSNTNIMAQLTSSFHNIARSGYALLSLPLTRRGLWSGDTDTATSGSAEAPLVVSGTFANDDPLGTPTNIAATVTAGGGTVSMFGGEAFIIVSNGDDSIDTINASEFSDTTAWKTTGDTKARLAFVYWFRHLTPFPSPTTIWSQSATVVPSISANARSIAFFANTKNTEANDILIKVVARSGNSFTRTQQVLIPGNTDITWRYLGNVSIAGALSGVTLEVLAGSVVPLNLYINDIVCLSTDGADWGVIKINGNTSGSAISYTANNRYVESLTPEMKEGSWAAIHEGTPFFNFTGDTAAMAFLSASPATDYWQLTAVSTPVTSSFVATRDRGFLIPI